MTTAPLVKDVLKGLNSCVFAYGATGSGKTHTMLGPNPKIGGDGLMVRAIDEIFQHVENADDSDTFKVSQIDLAQVYRISIEVFGLIFGWQVLT